jgi:hypothetical protein
VKPRTRACIAGALASVLVGTTFAVWAVTAAQASTEPVSAPLPAPSIVGPDDSGLAYPHPVRKPVKLDWAPVSGATGYRVEVGTDDTWSDDPVFTQDVFASEDTLPLWLPNATYAWRVAALQGSAVGHWSSESGQAHSDPTFTTGWRSTPTPNTVTTPFVGYPTFSWSPVTEASGYELQVSTDPFDFAPVSTAPSPDTTASPAPESQAGTQPTHLIADCMTPRTRVTAAQDVVGKSGTVGPCNFNSPDEGTPVYWRVRALDAFVGSGTTIATTPGAANGVSYQPPSEPDKPRDLTSGCPTEPSTASPSPSASASATAIPSASPKPLDLTCEPSRPSVFGPWRSGTSFAWNHAVPAGIAGLYAPTASMQSDPDHLCTVTNPGATQAEHALCRDVPTIRWSEVSGAGAYRVVIALDDAFTNIQYEAETSALQWTPPGSWRDSPSGTSYYYAVQGCDGSSCGPVTTTPPSFSKATPRPTLGTAPANAGEIHLSWQSYAATLAAATGSPASQDAYAYHLQVATSDHPTYDQVIDDEVVDDTSFTPLKDYGDGSFVWRVQPLDSFGDRLPYSLSQSFVRDVTPPSVASVTPSAGVKVNQPLSIVFSEPVTGVSTSSVSVSPATGATLAVTSSTTATLTPTKVWAPGATYRVMVSSAVHDLSGNVAEPLGPTFAVKPQVDDSSKALSYGGTWRILSSSNATGGTYHGSIPTSTAKTTASTTFGGIGVSVLGCKGPANGYLDVYVDGVKKMRVSLYRTYSGCGVGVAKVTGLSRGLHTLKVVGVGAHASASKGNAVAVDYVGVYV